MSDCLFCKIANGEIPSETLYKDNDIIVFKDISPAAPTHFLIVPTAHIKSAEDLNNNHADLLAKIFAKAADICKQQGITNGYRIVTNIGKDGGQSVGHLHFHVLAGRALAWPPG